MADISFAPSGGLRGFLGGHNYGMETEKTLQDMLLRKKQGESYDMNNKLEQLKYDQMLRDEEAFGKEKRDFTKQEFQHKSDKMPFDLMQTRARAREAVSEADIAERKAKLDEIQHRMDAMEKAALFNRQRSQGHEGVLPPSPLDKSLESIQQILKDGGWNDKEPWFNDPVSLVDKLEQGYQAAQVDKKKLAERRKHLDALELVRAKEQARPDPAKKFPNAEAALVDLLRKDTWEASDYQEARTILPLVEAKLRTTAADEITALGLHSKSPEERQRITQQLFQQRARAQFGPIYDRLNMQGPSGGSPTPQQGGQGPSDAGGIQPGTAENPIDVSSPSEVRQLMEQAKANGLKELVYKTPDGKIKRVKL